MSLTGPSVGLQDRLRTIFDAQVMNYGAYNLVCTVGAAAHRDPVVTAAQAPDQRHFLVGYRRGPAELIIAPFDPATLEPAGRAIAVDNTNMVRGEALTERSVLLETTSGSEFRLEIAPLLELPTAAGVEVLEQEADVADFLEFLGELLSSPDGP